jgi:hypothetical protein
MDKVMIAMVEMKVVWMLVAKKCYDLVSVCFHISIQSWEVKFCRPLPNMRRNDFRG